MQQPDYTSSSPYYPYPANPNHNPTQSSYASAPPYNYPSSDHTPHSPLIPDHNHSPLLPQFNPNSPQFNPNPNPNYPQFTTPQPNSYYPQPDSHQTTTNYPQLSPYDANYPKFDQFGSSRVDSAPLSGGYGNPRIDSGSALSGFGNSSGFGSRVDPGPVIGGYVSSRVETGSGLGGYGSSRAESGSGLGGYGSSRVDPGGYGDGIYAYQGSGTEPYGARGTGPKSWGGNGGSTQFDSGSTQFDDFGRPIGAAGKGSSPAKVVRAVPKAETREDEKGGVQKFRVKLLAESAGQTTMDVLCQIGLDGIRMLDPSTSRTLRIYPLETINRFEVLDSSIFAFWAKTPVDIEPRRIRLKSNSYTSSTILDIVTAATIQFKEIGGRSRPADSFKPAEQPQEKKKGLGDWMNLMKPGNEEKDHWVPDEAVSKCTACGTDFGAFVRRHHCRNCGDIFCDKCTHGRIALTAEENAQPVRVCDRCLAEVTHRLNIAKESSNRSTSSLQSHEDLAKKLQEEMERNRRASSGSRSDGSGRRMKEVACPTCTVHLQVQVPSSGSETIECGVCQNPFLVSAR